MLLNCPLYFITPKRKTVQDLIFRLFCGNIRVEKVNLFSVTTSRGGFLLYRKLIALLLCVSPPCGNIRYQIKPAGAVHSHQTNELRGTDMPRLRRVNRLCSSMVSGTADSSGHGSTLCSPTVEKILCRSPISERSPVSGLRQAKKQRETGVKRVETAGVYPLAHRRGYGESSAVRRRQLSAEVQRKTFRPDSEYC